MTTTPTSVRTVAVVGTGIIGTGWAAYLLAHGLDVLASDPAPGAEQRLRADVQAHWPALVRRGLAPGADVARLRFTPDPAEAARDADFVQENAPEREEVKDRLIAVLDEAAGPLVVIASSSSGLLPSRIQAAARHHPERVLVGHPFNPVEVIPLVEVVPGAATDETAVRRATAFYAAIGKRPVRLRQELVGHLANRLQAALWREAYSLVDRGAASVADVDTVIAYGPGLRWALLGPFANQHLSGGAAGLAHVLEHLGPPMQLWWDDLGTPTLTSDLAQELIAGMDAELAGIDRVELVRQRDALLDLLLAAKDQATALP